jgi:hypothetical protein
VPNLLVQHASGENAGFGYRKGRLCALDAYGRCRPSAGTR